jgi:hypothetical protein
VGGVDARNPLRFCERTTTPNLASRGGSIARDIARMIFTESVGTVFCFFFLSFTDGKQFKRAVGVALST